MHYFKIPTYNSMLKLAKENEVTLILPRSEKRDLDKWMSMQKKLRFMKAVVDLQTAVEILKENQIKGSRPIFNEKYPKEMVAHCYDKLSTGLIKDYDLGEFTEEYIVHLLRSKELNEAQYFSTSFKVGVYLPLFSPLLTLFKFFVQLGIKKLKERRNAPKTPADRRRRDSINFERQNISHNIGHPEPKKEEEPQKKNDTKNENNEEQKDGKKEEKKVKKEEKKKAKKK